MVLLSDERTQGGKVVQPEENSRNPEMGTDGHFFLFYFYFHILFYFIIFYILYFISFFSLGQKRFTKVKFSGIPKKSTREKY